jgi:hypothetical protein
VVVRRGRWKRGEELGAGAGAPAQVQSSQHADTLPATLDP